MVAWSCSLPGTALQLLRWLHQCLQRASLVGPGATRGEGAQKAGEFSPGLARVGCGRV